MLQKEAEILLVASEGVVTAAKALSELVIDVGTFACGAGPVCFVQGQLDDLSRDHDPGARAAANQALEAIEELRSMAQRGVVERERAERLAYSLVNELTAVCSSVVVDVLDGLGSGVLSTRAQR
ncbi:hypothetical protein [Streptomyces sp. NBC_00233]|uniref:hypothetical protein n=1 Tax=Streptomyces sp. NBC_00233 TaxID=2975686 RepID=UPI002259B59E|nr:hypothetical protein [Streptomyces sp. NBC_00233]MCX5232917.1 hypothetical protein [Streptomyces sp. NBC_00233]